MKTFSTLLLATLLLSACQSEPMPVDPIDSVEPDTDGMTTYSEGGLEFEYPAAWIMEDEEGTGFRLSNAEGTDGCEDPYGMLALYSKDKDAGMSFDEFAHSAEIYDQGGGLGQMGGTLTESTLAGKTAYHAEATGWESFCNDEGYLVEVDADTYLWLGLFTSDDQSQVDELQAILDSMKIE